MMSLFRTVVFALTIIAGLYLVFGREPAPQPLISLDDAIKNIAATIHNIEKEYPSSDRDSLAVDEISVRFVLHAAADDDGNMQLKLSNQPSDASDGVLATGQSPSGPFGNIMTITFKQAGAANATASTAANIVSSDPQQTASISPAAPHTQTARSMPASEARKSRTHEMTSTVVRIAPSNTVIPKPFIMQQE